MFKAGSKMLALLALQHLKITAVNQLKSLIKNIHNHQFTANHSLWVDENYLPRITYLNIFGLAPHIPL